MSETSTERVRRWRERNPERNRELHARAMRRWRRTRADRVARALAVEIETQEGEQ